MWVRRTNSHNWPRWLSSASRVLTRENYLRTKRAAEVKNGLRHVLFAVSSTFTRRTEIYVRHIASLHGYLRVRLSFCRERKFVSVTWIAFSRRFMMPCLLTYSKLCLLLRFSWNLAVIECYSLFCEERVSFPFCAQYVLVVRTFTHFKMSNDRNQERLFSRLLFYVAFIF